MTDSYPIKLRSLGTNFTDSVPEVMLIALVGNSKVVGTVTIQLQSDTCISFRKLFVEKYMRGRGIGKQLVKACLNIARLRRSKVVGILVHKDNREVAPFYEKLGFRLSYEYSDGSWLYSHNLED